MSKKINIFVGNVGSAYIDKETAQKNVVIAQQNILDCESLIEKANSLITKINAAQVTANQAKDEAAAVKSILDNVIAGNSNNSTKLNKLNALKNELINNDTDGISLNGGNVNTANLNIANLNKQLTETQSILEDALNLKEDNEKLLLTRQEELTTSTNEFNSYMPEPSQEDQSNTIEGSLNNRIDEVETNIDIANETTQAINDTTQDVYNKINEITSEPDETEDIVLNKLFWYAGQRQLDGDVFEVTNEDCTENAVDTWHVLTIKKINDGNFIVAGIDSNSDITTWNVIVPKHLNFTPVKADLTERDTNWTEIRQVTVNDTPSIVYEVNNEVSKLTSSPIKRLNVLMTTDEIIEPEPTGEEPTGEEPQPDLNARGYWYVGLTAPTQPYLNAIAANLITDGSEVPGWRKIENEFNTYNQYNPLYTPYEGIDFGLDDESTSYIVIPQGFALIDGAGYNPIASNDPRFTHYNQIIIDGVNYNVYSTVGYGFGYSIIFIGGNVEPEPTGEEPTGTEPTGEEITGEDIVFAEQPTTESIIERFGNNPVKPVDPQTLNMNSLTTQTSMYLAFPKSWLVFDENENLVKPKITNSLGFELGYEIIDTIEVNGIEYGVFSIQFGKDTFTIEF